MCGIAGVVGPGDWRARVEVMTAALAHRGPDDSGVLALPGAVLGHRRLAILDLSPSGHQPMALGDLTIVYNGEVYNHRELRKELPGPFVSDSDTEVILHLYARDGEACLDRLRGMFAFAIWDARRRTLFAARDRLGMKPFHWCEVPGGLAFASEIKALRPLVTAEVDRHALAGFFTSKYTPGERTIHRAVRKLLPGHVLTWEGGEVRTRRYWAPDSTEALTDPEEARGRLSDLLATAVPEHVLSDVPVGVFLSGGLDSTTLVAHLRRPRTFTLGLAGSDRSEEAEARRTAELFQTEHVERIVDGGSIDEALDLVPRMLDEPFGDSAAWSAYLVAREARKHVTVALSGEGGDELFSGYRWHHAWLSHRSTALARILAAWLPPFSPAGLSLQRRALTGLERYAALTGPFTPAQQRALLAPEVLPKDHDPFAFLRPHWREELHPIKRMQWLDLHAYLPDDLLVKADRTGMAVSLEVRPPFLDHRLVEFALSLSPTLLRDGARGKLLLRDHLRTRVPADVLERPKRGFSVPVRRWLSNRPELLRDAGTRLHRGGILRSPRLPRLHDEQAWSLLTLDRWATLTGAW